MGIHFLYYHIPTKLLLKYTELQLEYTVYVDFFLFPKVLFPQHNY